MRDVDWASGRMYQNASPLALLLALPLPPPVALALAPLAPAAASCR